MTCFFNSFVADRNQRDKRGKDMTVTSFQPDHISEDHGKNINSLIILSNILKLTKDAKWGASNWICIIFTLSTSHTSNIVRICLKPFLYGTFYESYHIISISHPFPHLLTHPQTHSLTHWLIMSRHWPQKFKCHGPLSRSIIVALLLASI